MSLPDRLDAAGTASLAFLEELFEQYAAGQEILVEADFAAKHSVNRARMYNILCWFYGHDPAEHGDLVTDGWLPEDRARGCEDEYKQLHKSWAKNRLQSLKNII